jgi:GNAT superfamily N-acetyltransferase
MTAWGLREPHWNWTPKPLHATVLKHGGRVVGVVRLFPRFLISRDLRVPIIGLGGLYVLPAHRRQSAARVLIAATLQRLRAEHVLAVGLFAPDYIKGLFIGLGFETVWDRFMIYSLTPSLDFFPSYAWSMEPNLAEF